VIDRFHDGQWMCIGMPAYDSYLSTELDRLIGALDARGAKVVLLTTPCVQPQERPDGGRWAEDDPARITRFNHLLASARDRHPGQVSLLDLDSMLCPAGQLTSKVDGVAVRGEDGIHTARRPGHSPAPAGTHLRRRRLAPSAAAFELDTLGSPSPFRLHPHPRLWASRFHLSPLPTSACTVSTLWESP